MDKKYLFKRNSIWWVKVAVPKKFRSEFGYDLRQTTGEKDLDKALLVRDSIVSNLKSKFLNGVLENNTDDFLQKTDITDPQYFHKVVDCQYACPAHTNVPEYIRLIAQKKYTDAYMLNWESNVFPGILGRTCDRPCEPACRRTRTHDKPVAICRLKRVTYDNKGDIEDLLPETPKVKNGKKIAMIGAGPASLTVARDLLPLGYECTIFEKDTKPGGLMRTNIPSFRLPESVLDEEVFRIIKMGADLKTNTYIDDLKPLIDDFDAVFVGSGAPKGKDLNLPGRKEAQDNIHIGIDWLTSIAFEHTKEIGKKVLVIGGGNTAMDCCRSAIRLGAKDVKVTVRSPFKKMKASDWEIEEAMQEGIPILDNTSPKEFLLDDAGKLCGMKFDKMIFEEVDGKSKLVPSGEEVIYECDDVLLAIGQDNAFPWIRKDIGIEFGEWDMPIVDKITMQSSHPKVFFGGDAAWGPENIIWAVAHGHQAAISIDNFCSNIDLKIRPEPITNLVSQKMGIHEWSYDNDISQAKRLEVPHADLSKALDDLKMEVELGFDEKLALEEAQRCLNCDMQTVFEDDLCIECDACVDICPTDCINFIDNDTEQEIRGKLRVPALNLDQSLYVSGELKTKRRMVKDEDMCVHCGLCAERCPTGAWDMKKHKYIEGHTLNNKVKVKEVA
ncbi:MAG: FAD-dependent oxidoreductase [Pseudomonadota bacterium]|nr:FAD-dependent oxidoreductase [Pseudomonadota bacterium]